jgi:hypothetical protein
VGDDALATPAKWRDDTTLEAAGAELLVVAHLLIDRFQVYRAYGNQPGYDALVVNPSPPGNSVKLQIKSRVALDSGRFKISHPDFHFCVFVRLNRGTKAQRRDSTPRSEDVEFYIASKADLCAMLDLKEGEWTSKRDLRVSRDRLIEAGTRNAWHRIAAALGRS